jgi:hypothetical protein
MPAELTKTANAPFTEEDDFDKITNQLYQSFVGQTPTKLFSFILQDNRDFSYCNIFVICYRIPYGKRKTEEEEMVDQQLLTDLVLAEMNIRKMIKINKISFNDIVRKTFMDYEVNSFYDLIKFDELKALELREIAKKEHLI